MSASEMYPLLIDGTLGHGCVTAGEESFGEIYRLHHDKILRYCCYRLRDRHEAEDVTQEAFARAWRSMPTFPSDRNFYPWLRVVAGNLCTDVQRKRSRSEPVAAVDSGFIDGNIDRVTDDVDRDLVRQALGRLNDRHRSALMMREDEGLTYDQIAARTGATTATVESLLWRARQALKKEFTVLAGREGCVAVIPGLAMLGSRLRSGGRGVASRTWLRALRRLSVVGQSGGDGAAVHALMAAVAAIAMVTGVTLTLGLGGHGAGTSLQLRDRISDSSARVSPYSPAWASSASSVPGYPAVLPGGSSPGPAVTPATPATPAAPATSGRRTPVAAAEPPYPYRSARVEVMDPVTIGRTEAAEAHQDPVALSAGKVTVGINVPATTGYVEKTVARLAPAIQPSAPAIPAAPVKETIK